MPNRKGLGKGLEVLLGGAGPGELLELPVDAIHPNPRQPRKRFDSDAQNGLAESVRAQGVVQPVLVRSRAAGGWELIAGERRWRAAREAGMKTVPAVTVDGFAIKLQANVELPSELDSVLASGAEGIGLFRSEFMFMNRPDLPGEEEQLPPPHPGCAAA